MGSHPINLALRFLLELAALGALSYWGWTQHTGLPGVVIAVGLPLLAGTLWTVFRVPGDGGAAIVIVPGIVRLILELALFSAAGFLLYQAGQGTLALVLIVIVALHYLTSYDRIFWLVTGAKS